VVVLAFLGTGCEAFIGMVKETSAQMDYYEEAGRAAFQATRQGCLRTSISSRAPGRT
jgi:hypothetical protein